MKAGKLRNLFTVLADTGTTKNAHGEKVKNWTPAGTFCGELKALAGRMLETSKIIAPTADYRINARFLASLTTANMLQLGERRFHINSVLDPDETQREMNVLVTEMKR